MDHTTQDSAVLELNNVSHVYPNGTRALDHVTLSIPRGLYGLYGPKWRRQINFNAYSRDPANTDGGDNPYRGRGSDQFD